MAAERKIPDSLAPEVIAAVRAGYSLRRTAEWLGREKGLDVSRSAVSGCLARAGMPAPEPLADAHRQIIEELPENLDELTQIQIESDGLYRDLVEANGKLENAGNLVRLLAQRERIVLYKLRLAGIRSIRELQTPAATKTQPAAVSPAPVVPPAPTPAPAAEEALPASPKAAPPEVGRNARCPCGSGHKYKRCHGAAPRSPVTIGGTDAGSGAPGVDAPLPRAETAQSERSRGLSGSSAPATLV